MPPKKQKKQKARRIKKRASPDVIRAIKFKGVEVPKIKAMPSHSAEIDFAAQAKKETSKQPIIIHNYLYPPGSTPEPEYSAMTGSLFPLRSKIPTDTQSIREQKQYDDYSTMSFVDEIPPPDLGLQYEQYMSSQSEPSERMSFFPTPEESKTWLGTASTLKSEKEKEPFFTQPTPPSSPRPTNIEEPSQTQFRVDENTAKYRRMVALQNRGGPYTKEEAKLVFGLDLRKRADKETLQAMIEQGLVK